MVVMDQADERRKERRTDGQSCLLRLCLTVFRVRIVTLLIAHLILLLPTASVRISHHEALSFLITALRA